MTTKQKISIAIISSLVVGSYLTIFIYQRIERAKADASVVSEEEALKILNEKSSTPEPDFTPDEIIPKLPDEGVVYNDSLQQYEIVSGMGDY
jgi:hypothetical protein